MMQEPSHETIANPRNPRICLDVEELLRWTYQDQAADAVIQQMLSGLGPGAVRSNLVGIRRNGLLGTQIDCAGGAQGTGKDLHPDAEAVHDAVLCLTPVQVGLVIHHAKTAGRPDWMEGKEPRPIPIRRANGKPLLEYHDAERRKPSHCLLCYDPEPEHLEFVRGIYLTWWDGLRALADSLRALLGSHDISGPVAPRKPWLKKPC